MRKAGDASVAAGGSANAAAEKFLTAVAAMVSPVSLNAFRLVHADISNLLEDGTSTVHTLSV